MNISIKILFFIVFSHSITAVPPKAENISSVQDALVAIKKIINNFPVQDIAAAQLYEKNQSSALIACAKVLYDTARLQILHALQEIDNRLTYWQYQKDHQWKYFLSKNPLKWFTGPSQHEEIENNLELLKNHQGELYVLLGNLSEQGNAFTQGYKDIFLTDYYTGYGWIDRLLDTLSRVKGNVASAGDNVFFLKRALLLKSKLENVSEFKNSIMAEMSETKIPHHIERNWAKYGALMFGVGYGLAHADQVNKIIGPEAIAGYWQSAQELILKPVGKVTVDVLRPSSREGAGAYDVEAAKQSIINFLDSLKIKDNAWLGWGDITQVEKDSIIKDVNAGKTASFQNLVDNLALNWRTKAKGWEGNRLWLKLLGLEKIEKQEAQYAGVGKIALLTPAIFSSWLAYSGYHKLIMPNYSLIRRALIDINALFVDQSKSLDDEAYGKMIYLLYNLKQRAAKDLSQKKNLREEFLHDLERIESKDFGVAAKRAIVDDMFRKYSFLGLVQKK